MEIGELFGDLRSLLQGRPTRRVWGEVCREIDHWTLAEIEERILPYADGLARRWADADRVAPSRWVNWDLEGVAVPQLMLARALDLSLGADRFALDHGALEGLVASRRLGRVRQVSLENQRGAVAVLEALCGAPWFGSVRALSCAYTDLFDSHLFRVCEQGQLSKLERLDLSFLPIGHLGVAEALGGAPGLLALNMRGVELQTEADAFWEIPRGSVTALDARECFLDEDGVLDGFLDSEWASGLEKVAFSEAFSPEELTRFVGSEAMTSLEQLSLVGCPKVDRRVVRALTEGPLVGRLKALDLRQRLADTPGYGKAGAETIARGGWESLRAIALSGGAPGWTWGELLRRPRVFEGASLEALTLEHASVNPGVLEVLLRMEWARGLETLELRGNPLGVRGVRALLGSPVASRLRVLGLANCGITQEGVVELANAKELGGLESLDVRDNSLGARARHALKHSEVLAGADILGMSA